MTVQADDRQLVDRAQLAASHWKRTLDWNHLSGFRYFVHHPGDRNRELTVTVLVFDVRAPC